MPQNAESFSPNVVILPVEAFDFSEGILRLRADGDHYDRVQIHADGTILVGDGAEAPAALDATNVPFDSTDLDNTDATTVAGALADFDAAITAAAV